MSSTPSYPSKTKKSKCYYCRKEMLDDSLSDHCMSIHKEVKRVKGQQLISFQPRAKKNKLDTQTASSSIADVISNVSLPSEKIDKSSQSVPTESDLFSVVTENTKKLDLILNKFNELTLSSDNGLQPFIVTS